MKSEKTWIENYFLGGKCEESKVENVHNRKQPKLQDELIKPHAETILGT